LAPWRGADVSVQQANALRTAGLAGMAAAMRADSGRTALGVRALAACGINVFIKNFFRLSNGHQPLFI
jgi:hypothetical protein